MKRLEHSAEMWELLLSTIEGKLEMSKCWMYIIERSLQENGTVKLKTNKTPQQLTIQSSFETKITKFKF